MLLNQRVHICEACKEKSHVSLGEDDHSGEGSAEEPYSIPMNWED